MEVCSYKDGFTAISLVQEPDDKDARLKSWVPTWDDVDINMRHVTYYRRLKVRLVTYEEYLNLIKEDEEEGEE